MHQDLWRTQWIVNQRTADREAEAVADRFFREVRPRRPDRRCSLRPRGRPIALMNLCPPAR
jgi:hypothetical protein